MHFYVEYGLISLPSKFQTNIPTRVRAVPIFPLEFVEPRKVIAGARKPRQGKTREARKIGTADNLLFKIKMPTFVTMSQSVTFNQLLKFPLAATNQITWLSCSFRKRKQRWLLLRVN